MGGGKTMSEELWSDLAGMTSLLSHFFQVFVETCGSISLVKAKAMLVGSGVVAGLTVLLELTGFRDGYPRAFLGVAFNTGGGMNSCFSMNHRNSSFAASSPARASDC